MTYRFHPEAEKEFIRAIEYYEEQERELGLDFSIQVYESIQRVITNPITWTKVSPNIRRVLLPRFPFGILYHFDSRNDQVFIVAVMHLRREPDYWRDRI